MTENIPAEKAAAAMAAVPVQRPFRRKWLLAGAPFLAAELKAAMRAGRGFPSLRLTAVLTRFGETCWEFEGEPPFPQMACAAAVRKILTEDALMLAMGYSLLKQGYFKKASFKEGEGIVRVVPEKNRCRIVLYRPWDYEDLEIFMTGKASDAAAVAEARNCRSACPAVMARAAEAPEMKERGAVREMPDREEILSCFGMKARRRPSWADL